MSNYRKIECLICKTAQYTDRDNCLACGKELDREGEKKQHIAAGDPLPSAVLPEDCYLNSEGVLILHKHKYIDNTLLRDETDAYER